MKFMVGIAEFQDSDEWWLMWDLASHPADTNTVRVPGFDALQDGGGPFVREAIEIFALLRCHLRRPLLRGDA